MNGCFIAGTDTEVGKTWISLGLMQAMKDRGFNVAGMKPVASGCVLTESGPRNEDALLIQARCSRSYPYAAVNPFALLRPIAPYVAARQEDTRIRPGPVAEAFTLLSEKTDVIIVEGVGGWRVHLDDDLEMVDLVKMLGLPVLIVVGMRLGCVNHAVLSAEAISKDGCELLGWVANHVDSNYSDCGAMIELLSQKIQAPLLGVIPHLPDADIEAIASCLQGITLVDTITA